MKPDGACSRADLVRALARGDQALADALAGLLGFEIIEKPVQQSEPDTAGTLITPGLTVTTAAPPPEIKVRPLLDVPFWRLETYEVVSEEPDEKRPPIPVETIGWRNRPPDPPVIRLLAPWRELQMRLRAVLAAPREGLEIDIDLTVRRLSRGRLLDRLPRRYRRRWGPYLQLVIDRSEHLVPYWIDQDQVRGELWRLFPTHDLEQAVFHEGLTEPRLLGASEPGAYRPPASGIVLVLGDLGCLTPQAVDEDNPWIDLGRRIQAAGCRPVALLPCPLARCPAVLRRYWQLIPWERPRGHADTQSGILRERAERLLRLVSPAVRIEPGLLRAVRLSLGADKADAGTESDVWQHPAIASTHSEAATLDPKRAQELRAAFAAERPDLQRRVLELLRTWRGYLPQEIWFEEILNLAPLLSREVPPDAKDLEDARQFFKYVCGPLESNTDSTEDAAPRAWIGRVTRRATAIWSDEVVGDRLLRVDWILHRHIPGHRPPVSIDPALLPKAPGQPTHRYELCQQGSELILSATKSEASETGSYLGTLRTGNRLVRIAGVTPVIDRNAFWQSAQPPLWADDWGTDEHGHWVTFSITDQQGNKITQRMRWIAPGTFLMGSPENEPERFGDEGPQHQVTISQGFWLFDTACTQALWQAVMGSNPSRFNGADRPVENVSWNNCQDFLKKLNERLPGLDLSLPTEAQWEYACRAGTTTPFSFGANITPEQVNYDGNYPYAGGQKGLYRQETVPVASLPPNRWGLYEMHGNVLEWTQDHWHDNYRGAPTNGSAWVDAGAGANRVIRGGSWNDYARGVRAAYRYWLDPGDRNFNLGFRCARVQVSQAGQAGAEPAGPASGRPAERRPAQVQPGGAARAEPILLRLDAAQPPVRCALPQALAFFIHTDRERLRFSRLTRPDWASAIGRDRFGLWSEIAIEPSQGEPVIQRLRWIAPGRFWMGSPEDEPGRWSDEGPQHQVTLPQGFWLFDTPCTQALWQAVMRENPSNFKSPTRPVEQVSWDDVQDFLRQINARVPSLNLVLPSEAQWEHACRAGTETAIYTGEIAILGENNAPALDPIAWYGGNSGVDFDLPSGYDSSEDWPEKQYPHVRAGTCPVKLKQANPWGLYDVLGNVWEWTQDYWHDGYQGAPTDGSAWEAEAGAGRVFRGGSWLSDARDVRAACRGWDDPGFLSFDLGFRCARVQV